MNIGIDARMYGARRNRGIGRYIEKLLYYLEEVDTENQYTIFLNNDNFDDYQPRHANFTKVRVAVPWYSWREQVLFGRLLKHYEFDLLHFTHFISPWFYRRPFVLTVHDLIMTHYADDRATTKSRVAYRTKLFFARMIILRSARRAKHIIVPTQYTRTDVMKFLQVPSEKITVIAEGVDALATVDINDVRIPAITRPYFFYVGAAYVHKNLDFLIKSFVQFNDKRKYQLVLAGRDDFFYQQLRARWSSVGDQLIFTGSVTNSQLQTLYRQAIAFVFPSLVEGFGLPALEAMQFGCPVLASRASCLPEVLQTAAWYFDPSDQSDLAALLTKAVSDRDGLDELVVRGRSLVRTYTWSAAARQTLAVYTAV